MSGLCWKCHMLCATSTAASGSPRSVVINGSYFLTVSGGTSGTGGSANATGGSSNGHRRTTL